MTQTDSDDRKFCFRQTCMLVELDWYLSFRNWSRKSLYLISRIGIFFFSAFLFAGFENFFPKGQVPPPKKSKDDDDESASE